ncbi:MAG: MFS transporter [Campylobacterales bacterium]|nr:MFS transporter [Campylobacterales bacterium]
MKDNTPIFSLILGGFYFFYFALIGIYIVFLPKILNDLGYSAFDVGVIYSAAALMRFLTPFIFKHLFYLDYKIYLYSLFVILLSVVLFSWSVEHFWFYLIINLMFGAAMGISLPYIEAISLEALSKFRYGRVRLWGSIGFMAIVLGLSLKYLFISLIIVAFLMLLFGAIAGKEHPSQIKKKEEDNSSFSLVKYAPLWISLLLMQLSFGGFYNFFTIYESEVGISLDVIRWMWIFGVLCEIIMLYFQGPLLQRNLLQVIKLTTLITALRWFMLYLFGHNTYIVFLSQSLHAFSFALYHTAVISYLFLIYTQKKLVQQFYLGISFGLGGSLGALLAGKLYGDNLFLYESLIALLAFGILYFGKKEHV